MNFTAKLINLTSFTVFINNQQYSANTSHPKYGELLQTIKDNDATRFLEIFDFKPESLINKNGFSMKDNQVYWNGELLHNNISTRIIAMVNEGFETDSMVKFLENLMQNPSRQSIQELYDFLSNSNLPITEDGCFLAYKSVVRYSGAPFTDKNNRQVNNGDLVDKYTRTLRNNIGDVLEMARNEVDDDRRQNCSYGYHAGGLHYVTHSYIGDQVLIVKINPKDVVSVPLDYSCQKLRTARYEVVGLYSGALNREVWIDEDDFDPIEDDEYEYGLNVDDLLVDDKIDFKYDEEMRCGVVQDIGLNHIYVILDESDPSYRPDSANVRTFTKNKITCITIL